VGFEVAVEKRLVVKPQAHGNLLDLQIR